MWASIRIHDLALPGKLGPTAVVKHHALASEADVADAACRLIRLLDRPATIPILQAQLLRELHFWLLPGQHGSAIRALGVPGGHAHRIARAVVLIRSEFAAPLLVERLAETAGMGLSSFHEHFRAQTSLTQKQLRPI